MVLFSTVMACASLQRMAPPVDQTVVRLGQQESYSPRSLSRGREIYLSKCSGCHSIEPIDRYTVARWREILPDMGEEANLGTDELADLEAYILTAYRFMLGSPEAQKGASQ